MPIISTGLWEPKWEYVVGKFGGRGKSGRVAPSQEGGGHYIMILGWGGSKLRFSVIYFKKLFFVCYQSVIKIFVIWCS